MTRTTALFAAVCCGALLFACGGSSTRQPTPTVVDAPPTTIVIERGKPLIIGVSAALSGDQMNLGKDLADAAELATADRGGALKGHPLQIERMDDGCTDAEKAVAVARSLIKETALVGVVGPMCTTGAQAADKLYEAAHVVHISPSATRIDLSQQGEQFFFRTSWRDDVQAQAQALYALGILYLDSATLIDDGEPYGKTLADAFSASYEKGGGKVLSRERIDRGAVDFTSLARQIKSANPRAVVFEGLNPEGVLIAKALHDADYGGTFIAPDGVLSARDFLVSGGPATEGAVVTGGATPDEAFVKRFQDRFQRAPGTPFVLQAHDAVSSLLAAIDSVAVDGSDGALVMDRARLAEALRAHNFAGLTGSIQFDENGDRRGDTPASLGVAIYRVVNGRFEPVR
jgi:branched-chain amino acid transport system substrate-binding protein